MQSCGGKRKNGLDRTKEELASALRTVKSDDKAISTYKRARPAPASLINESEWINENFDIGVMIGRGSFGRVYRAKSKREPERIVAIKEILTNNLPQNVLCEVDLAQRLGGRFNILETLAVHRDTMGSFIVMEYFPHEDFKNYVINMTTQEIFLYAINLVTALNYLHRNNLIHRDVKPDNFLYNRRNKRYALIDFGLSQVYNTNMDRAAELKRRYSIAQSASKSNATCFCNGKLIPPCESCRKKPPLVVNKAGTPRYLAPEILVGCSRQTTKIDLWAVGIILLYLVARKSHFFKARDVLGTVYELAGVFGSKPFCEAARSNGTELTFSYQYRSLNVVLFAFSHHYAGTSQTVAPPLACEYCKHLFRYSSSVDQHGGDFCLCRPLSVLEQADVLDHYYDRVVGAMIGHCLQVDPEHRISSDEFLAKFFPPTGVESIAKMDFLPLKKEVREVPAYASNSRNQKSIEYER